MADAKGRLVVPVGFRSDGSLHALELDTSDRLKVLIDAVTGTITVIQSTAGNLLVGAHGYDGSNWQKLKVDSNGRLSVDVNSVPSPITIDGQSPSLLRPSPKSDRYVNTSLAAGNITETAFTVPTGEYWRLTGVGVTYIGAPVPTYLVPKIYNGTNEANITIHTGITSGVTKPIQCEVLLGPGWKLQCGVVNATAGDDLYIDYLAERVY